MTLKITIKGVAAELVLGSYMPSDKTIFNNWEEFYNYNNVLHATQLIADHINEITITLDGKQVFSGKAPAEAFKKEKSFLPAMQQNGVYLRTECVENAVFSIETEVESFNIHKLTFSTQDYDLIFKTGKSFVTSLYYDGRMLKPEWQKAEPIGNICLLCGFKDGYLLPVYDAIKKTYTK